MEMKMLETKNLFWNKKNRTLVCDASDLYDTNWSQFDACVEVKSSDTNVVKCFSNKTIEYDNEHEIVCWKYFNADTAITLVIYND